MRDIMHVITGQLSKVSVPLAEYSDHGYAEEDVLSSYELEEYEWEKKIAGSDTPEFYPTISVTVVVVENSSRQQFNVSGESVEGSSIEVLVELPTNWPSKNFQALHAELGNTILHELEHLSQIGGLMSYDRGERYYAFDVTGEPQSGEARNYLLDPSEVAGHVIGYSEGASSMEDLRSRLRADLETYSRLGRIVEDDVEVVLSGWMDWAKKNLHGKKFK
ncbi:MAG TPA: hypothetical protein EYG51_25045 [Pseudomonadales bacterium]|nr:hypothetical protein [Pseudomonadales bacterium]